MKKIFPFALCIIALVFTCIYQRITGDSPYWLMVALWLSAVGAFWTAIALAGRYRARVMITLISAFGLIGISLSTVVAVFLRHWADGAAVDFGVQLYHEVSPFSLEAQQLLSSYQMQGILVSAGVLVIMAMGTGVGVGAITRIVTTYSSPEFVRPRTN